MRATRLYFRFPARNQWRAGVVGNAEGPPEQREEKRLAIHVRIPPLDYANFEGELPKGNYGARQVQIWDRGTYEVEGPAERRRTVERGDFKFTPHGQRLGVESSGWSRCGGRSAGTSGYSSKDRSRCGHQRSSLVKPDGDAIQITGSGSSYRSVRRSSRSEERTRCPTRSPSNWPRWGTSLFRVPDWLLEIKSGWRERAVGFIRDGELELRSRSGRRLPGKSRTEIPGKTRQRAESNLDGEIVVLDEQGRSEFARIQPRFGVLNPPLPFCSKRRPLRITSSISCMLSGYDLRGVPLERRKEELRKILSPSERVRFSDHYVEKGAELFDVAKRKGRKGLSQKRRDSAYAGRRTPQWLKLKIVRDTDVVIGGWTAPRKSRDHFGAFLMGLYRMRRRNWNYVGSVGTGFSQESLDRIYKTLSRLGRPEPVRVAPRT